MRLPGTSQRTHAGSRVVPPHVCTLLGAKKNSLSLKWDPLNVPPNWFRFSESRDGRRRCVRDSTKAPVIQGCKMSVNDAKRLESSGRHLSRLQSKNVANLVRRDRDAARISGRLAVIP
jgi:hypothetical protein